MQGAEGQAGAEDRDWGDGLALPLVPLGWDPWAAAVERPLV